MHRSFASMRTFEKYDTLNDFKNQLKRQEPEQQVPDVLQHEKDPGENSENEMEMEQEHGEQEQQVPQVPEQQRHAQHGNEEDGPPHGMEEEEEEPVDLEPVQDVPVRRTARSTRRSSHQVAGVRRKRPRREVPRQNANLPSTGHTTQPEDTNNTPGSYVHEVKTVFDKEDAEEIEDNLETEAGLAKFLNKRLIFMVVGEKKIDNPRIKIVRQYEARLPKNCQEAYQGQRKGSSWLQNQIRHPGVPIKKFSSADLGKFGQSKEGWSVQSIFKSETPNHVWVLFVGWDSTTMELKTTAEIKKTAPDMVKKFEKKNEFWKEVEKMYKEKGLFDSLEIGFAREKFVTEEMANDPSNRYWLYQDQSFFHTMIQENYGLGAVQYVCLKEEMVPPPKFTYTPHNIMREYVLEKCKAISDDYQKKLEEAFKKGARELKGNGGGCETPHTCKCKIVFETLFRRNPQQPRWNRLRLKHNADGLLEFPVEFDRNNQRIVIECTDACGCSMRCPCRPLQQVRRNPVIIFYNFLMNQFGLKTGVSLREGDLIFEYTGELIWELDGQKRRGRNSSYDADFKVLGDGFVISSWKIGNVARFMSHSCNPNAIFIEVYVQQNPGDPVIPRIAVYALRDIKNGEDVTIAYWDKDDMPLIGDDKCLCAPDCPRYLVRVEDDDDDDRK
ncbi:hypothetical protein GCK72_023099 [Caenorhabditis remanei]|uniref:SET domain-containing protein n=1 Tax=Caenorhabditis remanei TaxID=31234 RepID=A0A6A5FVT5_CAERE|nr:hypothetical protein GCK72_023099 [Caenorhabditis remanei]KAF1746642.1 hypothetical protein GCK72_023099 [Caenorhabditis remanei]